MVDRGAIGVPMHSQYPIPQPYPNMIHSQPQYPIQNQHQGGYVQPMGGSQYAAEVAQLKNMGFTDEPRMV
jgi:hypothetical protein